MMRMSREEWEWVLVGCVEGVTLGIFICVFLLEVVL